MSNDDDDDADEFEAAAWTLLGTAAESDDPDQIAAFLSLAKAAAEDAESCRRNTRREAHLRAVAQARAEEQARANRAQVAAERARQAAQERSTAEKRDREAAERRAAAKRTAEREAQAASRAKQRAAELAEDEAAAKAARQRRIEEERRTAEAIAKREAEERRIAVARRRAHAEAAVVVGRAAPIQRPPLAARPGEARFEGGAARPERRPTPEAHDASTLIALQALVQQASAESRGVAAAPPAGRLGADLLSYRQRRGLTQAQLATEWGITQGTIAKAEGAPSKPLGPALLSAMASAR